MTTATTLNDAGSQTLTRGLRALTLIGEATPSLTVAELAARLGIHRSMAYRLVAALERQGFVERTPAGALELGAKLVSLARGVAQTLQSIAERELAVVADELQMTAFVVVFDGEAAVTLNNVVPRNADMTLAQRPGSRHPIDRGAPGRVIRSQLDPQQYPAQPFEFSHDEVISGVASIAVPLDTRDGKPAALAVVFPPREVDADRIAGVLADAAKRISAGLR